MAAQIVSCTRETRQWGDHARLSIFTVTLTTATGGTGSIAIPNMDGWLMKVVTNPGATAPTDDYDITLIDDLGVDAAASLLLNRDTTNTEMVTTFVSGAPTPLFLAGTHTFTVANAGDVKDLVCTMYLLDHI
jgi:hypothetical protein